MRIDDFLHKLVKVETPNGTVEGVLKAIDKSWHGPLGTLILEKDKRIFIVKKWCMICLNHG